MTWDGLTLEEWIRKTIKELGPKKTAELFSLFPDSIKNKYRQIFLEYVKKKGEKKL